MLYSKSMNGFYDAELHGASLPPDVVHIADDRYAALLDAQAAGKRIIAGADGHPTVIDAPVAPRNVQAEIDALERASLTNRGTRELQLQSMRKDGSDNGWTDEQLAAKMPYFRKLKALDDQIRALRALL